MRRPGRDELVIRALEHLELVGGEQTLLVLYMDTGKRSVVKSVEAATDPILSHGAQIKVPGSRAWAHARELGFQRDEPLARGFVSRGLVRILSAAQICNDSGAARKNAEKPENRAERNDRGERSS